MTTGAANPTSSPRLRSPLQAQNTLQRQEHTRTHAHGAKLADSGQRLTRLQQSKSTKETARSSVRATKIRSQRTPGAAAASCRPTAPQRNEAADSRQHSLSCT